MAEMLSKLPEGTAVYLDIDFRWQEFRQLVPYAQLHPTPIPLDLLADLTAPL